MCWAELASLRRGCGSSAAPHRAGFSVEVFLLHVQLTGECSRFFSIPPPLAQPVPTTVSTLFSSASLVEGRTTHQSVAVVNGITRPPTRPLSSTSARATPGYHGDGWMETASASPQSTFPSLLSISLQDAPPSSLHNPIILYSSPPISNNLRLGTSARHSIFHFSHCTVRTSSGMCSLFTSSFQLSEAYTHRGPRVASSAAPHSSPRPPAPSLLSRLAPPSCNRRPRDPR